MSPPPVVGTSTFETLTDAFVRQEFPNLRPDRTDAVVGFASNRFQLMASPVRAGLQGAMLILAVPTRVLGGVRVAGWLRRTRLPVASEIPRAVRYLVVSYIWETWPDTKADGSTASGDVASEAIR